MDILKEIDLINWKQVASPYLSNQKPQFDDSKDVDASIDQWLVEILIHLIVT